jgi:hypothetical protein
MGIAKFLFENAEVILIAALGVSEALALSPKIKANGIFQAAVNGLGKLKELAGKAKG